MARVDFDTDAETRRRMQGIRTEDTPLEKEVADILYTLGCVFQAQQKDLPGKPDFVLPELKVAIFVHGCFWHGHDTCDKGTRRPKRNVDFWNSKIQYNKAKDVRVSEKLAKLGWRVVVIWECETRRREELEKRLKEELRCN
ncbi:MAG: very short patch repair endonuclease [Anaerolineae bacterium]